LKTKLDVVGLVVRFCPLNNGKMADRRSRTGRQVSFILSKRRQADCCPPPSELVTALIMHRYLWLSSEHWTPNRHSVKIKS
jgi:hypothetical protein